MCSSGLESYQVSSFFLKIQTCIRLILPHSYARILFQISLQYSIKVYSLLISQTTIFATYPDKPLCYGRIGGDKWCIPLQKMFSFSPWYY